MLEEIVRASDGDPITDALILIIIIQITVFFALSFSSWFFHYKYDTKQIHRRVRSLHNLVIFVEEE